MANIRASFGFVCDDARQETNGKMMFIGAFSGDIVMPEIPQQLAIRLVLYLENDGPGTYEVEAGVFYEGKAIAGASGQLQSTKMGGSFVPIPMIIPINGPGTLTFKFRQAGKRWQTVITLPVSTTASQPPS
ncbi:hypothetical protein [Mesorhizobium abyssinicae]|uniref:hypothetical protein n=1 Tax=Mesorhizobium abyssinicae TaxID=1209958 RepID=UPI003395A69B